MARTHAGSWSAHAAPGFYVVALCSGVLCPSQHDERGCDLGMQSCRDRKDETSGPRETEWFPKNLFVGGRLICVAWGTICNEPEADCSVRHVSGSGCTG